MARKLLIAGLAAGLAFSSPGCATILGRKTQSISVTARPAGARVLVDGRYVGDAPLGLRLAKGLPHVIRVEKEGYRPVEIRPRRRKAWPFIVLTNLIWAPPILLMTFNPDAQSRSEEFWNTAGPILAVSASLGAMALDALLPKSTVLRPRHLSITLEEGSAGREPAVIEMDPSDLRRVIWISVLDKPGMRSAFPGL
jgi:PEGA domain